MDPILPGSTIGIIGGGQLGRMLALEARRLDYRTVILDPDPSAPAAQVADEQIIAELRDLAAARRLAELSDVVTLEWENADLQAVRTLAGLVPVRPGPEVLRVTQNRLLEKETARGFGLGTAPFRAVRSPADLDAALAELGTPAILKTVFGGYDARGQRLIRSPADAPSAYAELGGGAVELILERKIDFLLEVSVLCARSPEGRVVSFPVVENIHRHGILDVTIAPARTSEEIRRKATLAGERLVEGLEVVGLLAVEMFVTAEGEVLVNEMAPRPHNSGHYTWEACSVSQFEQQIRAVCGLPIHPPVLLRPAAMANLLGEDIGTGRHAPTVVGALAEPLVNLHLYGKTTARKGRKMGHLTALGADADEAAGRARAARRAFCPNRSRDG